MKANAPPDGLQGLAAPATRSIKANVFPDGLQDLAAPAGRPMKAMNRRGQATTEVVLLFPVFMFFLFAFAKVFALLVLVQKMEIASFYAARRWQLESHRNVEFEQYDSGTLKTDIQNRVSTYLGYGTPVGGFLDLEGPLCQLDISRTQVWQVVTLTVKTKPVNLPFYKSNAKFDSEGHVTSEPKGFKFEVTKYVPNRDRPIAFVLPGLNP